MKPVQRKAIEDLERGDKVAYVYGYDTKFGRVITNDGEKILIQGPYSKYLWGYHDAKRHQMMYIPPRTNAIIRFYNWASKNVNELWQWIKGEDEEIDPEDIELMSQEELAEAMDKVIEHDKQLEDNAVQ